MYSAIIAASVIFQSLCALYYFKRGKLLQSYLEETPPWVVEIQRLAPATEGSWSRR
jgi:hypothetical protein